MRAYYWLLNRTGHLHTHDPFTPPFLVPPEKGWLQTTQGRIPHKLMDRKWTSSSRALKTCSKRRQHRNP